MLKFSDELVFDRFHPALVYHFWGDPTIKPFKSIILSIATFRAHNDYTPIYVLDCSRGQWGCYPKKLNFKVIHWKMTLPEIATLPDDGSEIASRFFDVRRVAKLLDNTSIMYCDADVFWLRNPLPLKGVVNRINMNSNAGFFYFDKRHPNVERTFEICESAYIIGAIDDDYNKLLWNNHKYKPKYLRVEIVTNRFGDLFERLPPGEHCLFRDLPRAGNANMIHFWGCEYNRGNMAMHFEEFYKGASKHLSEKEISRLIRVTPQELANIKGMQISLRDKRLKNQATDEMFHTRILKLCEKSRS